MRKEALFSVAHSDPQAVMESVRLHFRTRGWKQLEGEHQGLEFVRGSLLSRLLSARAERWPTRVFVSIASIEGQRTGVAVTMRVATGLHPVGRLDRLVLDAEIQALESYLEKGERRDVAKMLAPLRRPVEVAAALNMLLASGLVVWIGLLAKFPLAFVLPAAMLVALLDGIVIRAFADLMIEGTESVQQGFRAP